MKNGAFGKSGCGGSHPEWHDAERAAPVSRDEADPVALRRQFLGEERELATQPLMTLVPVIACVPEEAHRKGRGFNRLRDPGEAELALQQACERSRQR